MDAREPLINHRYRVLRQLGAGAMGTVHLVADLLDENQQLALKTIRKDFTSSYEHSAFKNEFQAMTTFHHPNVVEVYEFGTLHRTQDDFFTMEYVEGQNLVQACRDKDLDTLYDYAAQIGRALEYIHAQNFIHFDLKPDNIMVRRDGTVKVMDFGLVEQASFRQFSVLKGTVNYLAPEMIGGGKVDARLDLYSLGALLFHVLTGRTLFQGSLQHVLNQHLHAEPDFTRDVRRAVPEELQPLLRRLLAKDPEQRPRTASEFLIELGRITGRGREVRTRELSDTYVLGSRSVGQEAELARSKELFKDRILQPRSTGPALLLVTGPSGAGKSRLMRELRHHVQIHRVRFHEGSSLQNGGQPYLPFAEILRTLVRDILPDSTPSDIQDADGSSEAATRFDSSLGPLEGGEPTLTSASAPGQARAPVHTPAAPEAATLDDNSATAALPRSIVEPVESVETSEPTLIRKSLDVTNELDALALHVATTTSATVALERKEPTPAPLPAAAPAPAPASPASTLYFGGARNVPVSPLAGSFNASDPGTGNSSAGNSSAGNSSSGDGLTALAGEDTTSRIPEDPHVAQQLEALLREHAAAISRLVGDAEGLKPFVGEAPRFSRPELEKSWLLDSICRFLIALSYQRPLVIHCSDLHWADPLSVELLAQLARALAKANRERPEPTRMMLCGCYREDELAGSPLVTLVPALIQEGVAERLPLRPLSTADVSRLLGSMLGPVDAVDTVASALAHLTGGNPYFIVATVRDLLAEGAIVRTAGTWSFRHEALHGELAPRSMADILDRTLAKLSGDESGIVQLLSVINRPVSVPLLSEALGVDEKALRPLVGELRKKRFVARGWGDGHHQYSLRHNSLRDHAYHALDTSRRASLHLAAGTVLERSYGHSDRYLEDLAQHFRLGGSLDKAIHYARRAADQARRLYDLKRAATLYQQAYESHRLLGVDLAVSIAEASAYTPSEKNVERLKLALPVVEEVGDKARLARVQNWMGRTYYALGKQRDAIQWFTQFMKTTEGTRDDLTRALPHAVLGRVAFFMAHFESARTHLEKSVALLQGHVGAEEDISYALGMCGSAYAYQGYLKYGLKLVDQSIEMAKEIRHATREALGTIYRGIILAHHGHWTEAREWLDKGLELSHRTGDVIGVGTGSSFRGLVALAQGDVKGAIEFCRYGRDHIAKSGGAMTFTMIGSHLAEALLAAGDVDGAHQTVRDVLPILETGERWGESCLYLAQGRIHLAQGNLSEARTSFERALSVGVSQQAKPFEAKAHLALGALLRDRDNPGAHDHLDHARKQFTALGMRWYQERAEVVLAGGKLGVCP